MNFRYVWDIAPVVGLITMAGWVYQDEHGNDSSWDVVEGIRIQASPTAAQQLQEILQNQTV